MTCWDSDGTQFTYERKKLSLESLKKPQKHKKILINTSANKSHLFTYFPSGVLEKSLELSQGWAEGVYQEFYPSGILKIEAHVKGGIGDVTPEAMSTWVFDGQATAYAPTGILEVQFYYERGILEKEALYYDENGFLIKKIPYLKGNIEGDLEEYSFHFCHRKEHYVGGKKEGLSQSYWHPHFPQSMESYEKDRLIEGKYWDNNGILLYEVIQGEGKKVKFLPKSFVLISIHKGIPEGLVEEFDLAHNLLHTYSQIQGMKQGEERFYNAQGILLKKQRFHQGKLCGKVESFFPQGNKKSEKEIIEEALTGLYLIWYPHGALMQIEKYDKGRLIKGEYFLKDSTLISKVENGNGEATILDWEGYILHKITYVDGWPLE